MATSMTPKYVKKFEDIPDSFEKRFNRHVKKMHDCWIWVGFKMPNGYGKMGAIGLAHRISWMFHNKKTVPLGLNVLHSCDNPACVNPKHLHVGTQKENIREMFHKGRGVVGEDHPGSKLSNSDVVKIKTTLLGKISRKQIAKIYSVSSTLIDRIAWGMVRKVK